MKDERCAHCGKTPMARWLRVEIHTRLARYGFSDYCGRACVIAAIEGSEAVAPIGSAQAGEESILAEADHRLKKECCGLWGGRGCPACYQPDHEPRSIKVEE